MSPAVTNVVSGIGLGRISDHAERHPRFRCTREGFSLVLIGLNPFNEIDSLKAIRISSSLDMGLGKGYDELPVVWNSLIGETNPLQRPITAQSVPQALKPNVLIPPSLLQEPVFSLWDAAITPHPFHG